jgi:hypothetical protein
MPFTDIQIKALSNKLSVKHVLAYHRGSESDLRL